MNCMLACVKPVGVAGKPCFSFQLFPLKYTKVARCLLTDLAGADELGSAASLYNCQLLARIPLGYNYYRPDQWPRGWYDTISPVDSSLRYWRCGANLISALSEMTFGCLHPEERWERFIQSVLFRYYQKGLVDTYDPRNRKQLLYNKIIKPYSQLRRQKVAELPEMTPYNLDFCTSFDFMNKPLDYNTVRKLCYGGGPDVFQNRT